MACFTPSKNGYSCMSEFDVIKLIYENGLDQFDRQQQIIQAIENISGGGGGGGTSSNFGDPFPAAGTAAGFSDGTDMREARVYDTNSGAGTEWTLGAQIRVEGAGGSVGIPGDATNGLFVNVKDMPTLNFATDKVDVSGSSVAVTATNLDIRDLVFATDKVDVSGSTITATAAGTQDTNLIQILGVAPSATNPLPSRLTNGTAFLANLGETAATGQFIRLTDGTDTALVTAAGELNVLATAQPGVDIGDVTVNNGAGAGAVNIQDGGNSITVDGTVTVTATDLDIRDLAFATDKVDVSGSTITITPSGTQTVEGNKTNNAAAPGANNVGALVAIANAAAPSWTEGRQVLASVTLSGDTRITLDGEVVVLGAGSASIGVLGANSGVDIGDVTINNAGGGAAVNIQDGGNSITVDGTVTATPSGTQDTNITQLIGVAPSATNPFPVRPTDGAAFLANLGETAATGQFIRLTDGTDTALVTAAGELNVLATAQPGVDIGDVTVNNGAGASAVNIQDGGNSITVDGTVTATPSGTQDTNITQLAGNAVATGNGASSTGVLRVAQVDNGTGTLATVSTVTSVTQNADVRQATASNLNAQVVGNIAHDGVDSGNPVKTGAVAIAHGTNPTAVAAADRTNLYANRAGIPFVIGGHPNVITLEAAYTAAQTDTAIVTVGAGAKIVVTEIEAICDNANSVDVGFRIGFAAATTPTTTGVVLTHPGCPKGSGVVRGNGSGILGVGADGEDLRITSEVPTGGSLRVLVSYYTIES